MHPAMYIHPHVCEHVLKFIDTNILQTICGNFTIFTTFAELEQKDELITF